MLTESIRSPKRKLDAEIAAVIAEDEDGLEDADAKLDTESHVRRVESTATQNHGTSSTARA